VCEDRVCIRAHRYLLARTGSLVLKASVLAQPLQAFIFFEDFPRSIMLLMLTYLYTGTVSVSVNDLVSFSRLADTLLVESVQVWLASCVYLSV